MSHSTSTSTRARLSPASDRYSPSSPTAGRYRPSRGLRGWGGREVTVAPVDHVEGDLAPASGRRADRGFELPEERPARTLDHTEHLVEHSGPGIVRVRHVEGRGGRVERHQQRDLVGVGLAARPAPQDALVAAVERDDEVAAREVAVGELPGAVVRAVVAGAVERVDRPLVRALADMPVARAGARRGDPGAEARGIRVSPE